MRGVHPPKWATGALDIVSSTWVIGLLLAAVTWPVRTLAPQPGLDASWVAGLHMAAHSGLQFGPQVAFTYGPLGFLNVPGLYYTWPARLTFVYLAVVQIALCLTLVWTLRGTFGALATIGITVIVVPLISDPRIGVEPVSAIVFIWAAVSLREGAPSVVARALPVAGGALAALELLVKISTGVTVLAICALTILFTREQRWRRALAFVASWIAALIVLWLVAGQALSHLPDFAANSLSVTSGYSAAMGLSAPGNTWQLWAALAIVVLVCSVIGHPTRDAVRRNVRSYVLWAAFSLLLFKAGYVRNGHILTYLGGSLAGCLAFAWRPAERARVLLAATAIVFLIYAITHVDPSSTVRPVEAVSTGLDQVRTLADSTRRDVLVAKARMAILRTYALDPPALAELRGHTVDVVPYDTAIVWAAQLAWRPVPVFQGYVAYTQRLDGLNADERSSPHASERILRNVASIDNRLPTLDPPAANLQMLCHYIEVRPGATWQVLARVPNRCGHPNRLASVRARWGETVPVPAARHQSSLVFVRVKGTEPTGFERLRTFFYRALERHLVLDGTRAFRFIPGTAADSGLVTVPRASDYTGPFRMSSGARRLAVTKGDQQLSGESVLRLDFYEMPIAGRGSGASASPTAAPLDPA